MVVQVREIYETAIEAEEVYQLTDEGTKTLCLRYKHAGARHCQCAKCVLLSRSAVSSLCLQSVLPLDTPCCLLDFTPTFPFTVLNLA